MKKKFLSLVLMICLLIPCMFSLVGCGQAGGKGDLSAGPKISSEEVWNNALNLALSDMVTITYKENDETQQIHKFDGENYYFKFINISSGRTNENLYKKEGDYVYEYYRYSASWNKQYSPVSESNLAKALNMLNFSDTFLYSNFSYNEETKQYEANSIKINNVDHTDAKVVFNDGKCTYIEYTRVYNDVTTVYSRTFEYSDSYKTFEEIFAELN